MPSILLKMKRFLLLAAALIRECVGGETLASRCPLKSIISLAFHTLFAIYALMSDNSNNNIVV